MNENDEVTWKGYALLIIQAIFFIWVGFTAGYFIFN